jgi:hypothetical protein
MAIMDMAVVTLLAAALPILLKPGGKFVFSITHPIFNSGSRRIVIDEEDHSNQAVRSTSIQVFDYTKSHHYEGIGIIGQPEAGQYFHRSTSSLINLFTDHGFILDCLEEPVYKGERSNNKLTSTAYQEFPPFLFLE